MLSLETGDILAQSAEESIYEVQDKIKVLLKTIKTICIIVYMQ